jgi:hypothetical protein
MRLLAACAALVPLAACSGGSGFEPFDAGVFGTPTSGGSSSGGSAGGSSGGASGGSGGTGGGCGAFDAPCQLDGGSDAGLGICCGDGCTDSLSDPLNCGSCGIACATAASCDAGVCVGADGGAVSCVNTGCAAGFACVGSSCVAQTCSTEDEGDPCAFDAGVQGLCCGAACTNPLTDDLNCLTCNNACSSDAFCDGPLGCQTNSSCGEPADLGDPCVTDGGLGGVCCNQGCTATLSDPTNCGICGAICPDGASCVAGGCTTADAGPATCFGDGGSCPAGTGCIGAYCLGLSCADAGPETSCLFGVSSEGNPMTGECCGSSCVDLGQNPADCGACGASCVSGICAPGNVCLPPPGTDAGSCPVACTAAQSCVGTTCVDNACGAFFDLCQNTDGGDIGVCCPDIFGDSICADVSFDPSNCGGCGLTCPLGQGCTNGACSGSQGTCGAGTVGMYCDFDAGPTYLCCPGRNCTDVRTDILNCGGCSIECPDGTYCIDGNCLATSCGADSGSACELVDGGIGGCCNSACLDELHDPDNCGSCQAACTAPNGSCDFGVCGVDVCTQTSLGVPCPSDGVAGLCCSSGCIDTTSDPANCGNCGIACAADAGCFEGNCQ